MYSSGTASERQTGVPVNTTGQCKDTGESDGTERRAKEKSS